MKELANLMEYREDVKVVDATLRDGGLVNDFYFTDEFVKDLYKANIKAGVDYMEFGYKADKEIEVLKTVDKNCRLIKGQVFLWEGADDWQDLWDINGEIPGWNGYTKK